MTFSFFFFALIRYFLDPTLQPIEDDKKSKTKSGGKRGGSFGGPPNKTKQTLYTGTAVRKTAKKKKKTNNNNNNKIGFFSTGKKGEC